VSDGEHRALERRVLTLPATARDGELIRRALAEHSISCDTCTDLAALGREMGRGVGAILLPEESLEGAIEPLVLPLGAQPEWSDPPVLVMARSSEGPASGAHLGRLGNVTLLERPMRVSALVSAVRSALRARERQYRVREMLEERERVAETLRRQAGLLEQTHEAIFVWQLDGPITYWNRGAERLYGHSAADAVGRGSHELLQSWHPAGMRALDEILVRRGSWNGELYQRRHDGLSIVVHSRMVVVEEPDGRRAVLETNRDVSDEKMAEAERRRTDEKLQEANRRKDEFLATLAHELRNPLAPIRTALELLRMTSPPEPRLRWGQDVIDRQLRHLTRMVDDLLDVSRITRGVIELRREATDLGAVVQAGVETAGPAIASAGHRLDLDLPDEPVPLEVDPVRISQVFSNLLNNAAKYTPAGGHIRLHATRDGDRVVVVVEDDGIGIAPEILPGIFDLFAQADRSLDRAQGGLGIGLTLVRWLIELHHGTIEAASPGLGQGSTFTVRLPVANGGAPVRLDDAALLKTAVTPAAPDPRPGVPRRGRIARRHSD